MTTAAFGRAPPDATFPPEAFMAVPLAAYEPSCRGRVVFPPAFAAG